MSKALFVTRHDISVFTAANGNIDNDKLLPFINLAQDVHIQNYLGTDLYNKMKEIVTSSVLFPVSGTLFPNNLDFYLNGAPPINYGNALRIYPVANVNQTTSKNEQTFTINVTSLPAGGSRMRVNKTNASGAAFYQPSPIGLDLVLGLNTLTAFAVSFQRNLEMQFVNNTVVAGNTSINATFDEVIINGVSTKPYTNLLNDYIKPMLLHWSMVEYLPYAGVNISNGGIYTKNPENSTALTRSDVDSLIERARTTAQHYTNRFIDYMQSGVAPANYPEYYSNTQSDMYPDDVATFGGWVMN